MTNNKEQTYWPHMIVGFLLLGIVLGYWTIKSAISMPVQESNEYMLKYQKADININEILTKKKAFDKLYSINILDTKTMIMTDNINSNVQNTQVISLNSGSNSFSYEVIAKDKSVVKDAIVTFLLTRPHSVREDKLFENIPLVDSKYYINDVNITKEGRYTLQLRAKIGDTVGYSQISAYMKK
ncbi:MAG: hypothetical protein QM493_10810 [Sulfurovum sp.]